MPARSRDSLNQLFKDGARPRGVDFLDTHDSFLNIVDDGVGLDADSNLQVPNGLTLKDAANGQAGTLRFNSGKIQFHNGTQWNDLASGSTGAFTPVGGGPHVAFNGGNVGIGDFATPPTFRLDVNLGANTGPDQRVRFGNGVVSNGQGASSGYAQFSHANFSSGNDNFAIRQGVGGDVNLNAPLNQPITISQGRTQARLFIAANGQVIVGSNAPVNGSTDAFQVNGTACKIQGGNTWAVCSDVRLKQNIEPFRDGLNHLLKVRPVRFRYNGQLNTNPATEEVGIIGQEIEQVFPYMVSREKVEGPAPVALPDDLLMYNSNALTYVMVNAIQELANRVVELEKQLAEKQEQAKA